MSMGGLRHWLDVAGEYGLSARAWQFRRCAHVAGATDIASAQKRACRPSGCRDAIWTRSRSFHLSWLQARLGFPLCGLRRIVVMFAPPRIQARRLREEAMADDKRKRGAADRRRVAAGEPYEVSYFARKHGLSKDEALKIIKKAKGNRAKANALAEGR
jgi:hypothetical protein